MVFPDAAESTELCGVVTWSGRFGGGAPGVAVSRSMVWFGGDEVTTTLLPASRGVLRYAPFVRSTSTEAADAEAGSASISSTTIVLTAVGTACIRASFGVRVARGS